MLSRRRVLRVGGAGVAGIGLGLTAGLSLDRLLDDRTSPSTITGAMSPATRPGPVVQDTFVSAARGGISTRWSLIRPPDVDGPLPLVLALHGHGGSTSGLLSEPWDLPGALARAVVDGVPPFALATVSGGTSFWHPRPWGEDAGSMVIDELLPMLLARDDVLTEPIGLLGWSMGGYGALRIAGLLGRNRVAAVVASSPGLYTDPERTHPDGFVDATEYRQFSVMEAQDSLAGIPLRVDVGTSDPFFGATRVFVDRFPTGADVTAEYGEGGHEIFFTQRVLPAQLAFLGAHVGRTEQR